MNLEDTLDRLMDQQRNISAESTTKKAAKNKDESSLNP